MDGLWLLWIALLLGPLVIAISKSRVAMGFLILLVQVSCLSLGAAIDTVIATSTASEKTSGQELRRADGGKNRAAGASNYRDGLQDSLGTLVFLMMIASLPACYIWAIKLEDKKAKSEGQQLADLHHVLRTMVKLQAQLLNQTQQSNSGNTESATPTDDPTPDDAGLLQAPPTAPSPVKPSMTPKPRRR